MKVHSVSDTEDDTETRLSLAGQSVPPTTTAQARTENMPKMSEVTETRLKAETVRVETGHSRTTPERTEETTTRRPKGIDKTPVEMDRRSPPTVATPELPDGDSETQRVSPSGKKEGTTTLEILGRLFGWFLESWKIGVHRSGKDVM
jgi:hypothetical protein